MNILFYIPYISQEWGGVKQYTCNLLEQMKEYPDDIHVAVYHKSNDRDILQIINNTDRLKLVDETDLPFNNLFRALTFFLKAFAKIFISNDKVENNTFLNKYNVANRLVNRYNIDILHSPYQAIPVCSNVRLICTMHDMQQEYFPDFFSEKELAYREKFYPEYLKRSDVVVVSYQHIKEDVVRLYDIPKNKVHVILLQMDKLWFNNIDRTKVLSQVNLEVPEEYVLYPANTWPHKNHLNLLKAILYLKNEKNKIVNVVFTGNHNNDHGKKVEQFIVDNGLENQVFFKGIVGNLELFSLYQNARAVVIPTLYEAGSFPLMESILMEVPVICSNVTSLPETIGDDRFIFDPQDKLSIAQKLESIYENGAYRVKNKEVIALQKGMLVNTMACEKLIRCYEVTREGRGS